MSRTGWREGDAVAIAIGGDCCVVSSGISLSMSMAGITVKGRWYSVALKGKLFEALAIVFAGALFFMSSLGRSSAEYEQDQPSPVLTPAFSPTFHGGLATSSQSKFAKLDSVLERPPAIPRKTLTAILFCAVAADVTFSVLV